MRRIKQSNTFKSNKVRRQQERIKMKNEEYDDIESWESMTPAKEPDDKHTEQGTEVHP